MTRGKQIDSITEVGHSIPCRKLLACPFFFFFVRFMSDSVVSFFVAQRREQSILYVPPNKRLLI